MTSKFFRFLSRRGSKSASRRNTESAPRLTSHSTALNIFGPNAVETTSNNSSPSSGNKHTKLKDGNENLKETIEHYNQRCQARRCLNEKDTFLNSDEQKMMNKINDLSIKSTRNSKFFSFRSKAKYANKTDRNGQQVPKGSVECAVVFLDQTQESFYLPKKALAAKLYEKVFYHLDLIETDYFGLQFSDSHGVQHWLDPTKLVRKQCKIGPPFQFFFKVKFYTAEPNNLKEELTRYFYFLQLRSDLRTGRLPCLQEQIATELCTLILQEELGDYDPHTHSIDTVSEFRFLPEFQQTEQFEEHVFNNYATSTAYKAMSPAESELTFLNKAKWLEMYGVDMHSVYGRDQNEYKLGLTPSGILVFEEASSVSGDPTQGVINNKIGLFYWPKIENITFSKKKFTILVSEDDNTGLKQQHTFIFNLIDEKACKHLWKCAVEYHSFFRLKTSLALGFSPSNSGSGLFSGFIRKGSRFRGPERTEFQTHNMSRMTIPRRSVQFERKPSQRFSRRASYAIKRKLQEQQKRGLSCQLNTEILKSEKLVNSQSQMQAVPQPVPRSKSTSTSFSDSKLSQDDSSDNQKSQLVFNKSKQYGGQSQRVQRLEENSNYCQQKSEVKSGSKFDQKCNISKAQQMEKNQLNCVQTSFEMKHNRNSLNNNNNKSDNNCNRNNFINFNHAIHVKSSQPKLIDKKNIFQTIETSKQINSSWETRQDSGKTKINNVSHSSKPNGTNLQVQRVKSASGVAAKNSSYTETTQMNYLNLDQSLNNSREKNFKANILVSRSSSDSNNQQKANINHMSMNRNLINFSNNVSSMQMKQQNMTEI